MSNIFLNEKLCPVIADWGLATKANGTTLGGTRSYMDPKRDKIAQDLRPSDIWSLGMMFYEMIEAKYPFNDDYLAFLK
jgi:serine/threonine protein kinase